MGLLSSSAVGQDLMAVKCHHHVALPSKRLSHRLSHALCHRPAGTLLPALLHPHASHALPLPRGARSSPASGDFVPRASVPRWRGRCLLWGRPTPSCNFGRSRQKFRVYAEGPGPSSAAAEGAGAVVRILPLTQDPWSPGFPRRGTVSASPVQRGTGRGGSGRDTHTQVPHPGSHPCCGLALRAAGGRSPHRLAERAARGGREARSGLAGGPPASRGPNSREGRQSFCAVRGQWKEGTPENFS